MPMPNSAFTPRQIAYLACDQGRLYTEVIEVLADRQLCWARPLLLVTPEQTLAIHPSAAFGPADQTLWGDSKAPDLLWPLAHFYPALDTDFLDVLASPLAPPAPDTHPTMAALLTKFIRCLWETTVISPSTSPPDLPDNEQ
jgi:hypothetical protein